jgi:hypothetical protein
MSKFGGFWDSVIDRVSDILLFIGLIYLYSSLGRTDYVMVASFAMMFALMTSYTRARAESLIDKCKVGFMERPERMVLFMIGASTNRMAGVLWVILVLSVFSVADRVILTYRVLEKKTERPSVVDRSPLPVRMLWNVFFWTFERATWQYDLMVIAILGFVWLVPPGWIGDPVAHGSRAHRVALGPLTGANSQRHNSQLPNKGPTPNCQNAQAKNRNPNASRCWDFWALGIGRLLGIGSCGVGRLTRVTRHLVRRVTPDPASFP